MTVFIPSFLLFLCFTYSNKNLLNKTWGDSNIKTITTFLIPMEYYSTVARGSMLDTVYSMRYASYSAENYIEKNSSRKFMDEYDSMPNCTSYLTYFGKKAIGSIRSCIYKPEEQLSIPVINVFEEELKNSVSFDNVIIEANKFVIDLSFQKHGGVKARLSIFRNIANSLLENKAKYLVAGVRSAHIKFHKSLYFEPASEIKVYPHLKFKTVLVICKNVSAFCEKIYSKMECIELNKAIA